MKRRRPRELTRLERLEAIACFQRYRLSPESALVAMYSANRVPARAARCYGAIVRSLGI